MMKNATQRDPYLYDDIPVLRNIPGIRDYNELRKAEGDITAITMAIVYGKEYRKFNTETLKDIHRTIFGGLFEWAGEFRTIHIRKPEEVLGGDTVRYAFPAEIKKQLDDLSREIAKLKPTEDHKTLLFKIVRLTGAIWQVHPFREGNTRAVVSFSLLLAEHLGISMDYSLFAEHASYVRNALVWCTQGIYSKYEYLEQIYYDAAGLCDPRESSPKNSPGEYALIEGYNVKDYKEQPHTYVEE